MSSRVFAFRIAATSPRCAHWTPFVPSTALTSTRARTDQKGATPMSRSHSSIMQPSFALAGASSRRAPGLCSPVRQRAALVAAVRSGDGAPRSLSLADDRGAATAEYAIATMAAVGFASLLVVIMRSDEVRGILTDMVRTALSFGG